MALVSSPVIEVGTGPVAADDVVRVARFGVGVRLTDAALAEVAHVALALMGEGEVRDASGELWPAGEALRAAGIEPVVLAEKEGLALVNGTDGMLGMLLLALADLRRLLTTADLTAAMSVE